MAAVNLGIPLHERPRRTPTYLNMSEWFGPTIQGEGRNAGRTVGFIRTALCNLSCSWCDTPYTWDWERYDRKQEVKKMSIEDVSAAVLDLGVSRIVVSGGEPLSQAAALAVLMRKHPGISWELETNGTKPLGDTAGLWGAVTCSPKIIPSADQGEAGRRIHPDMFAVSDFKFVIHDEADLAAVDAFTQEHDLPPERIWLMPEGVTPDALNERSQFVAEAAAARGYSFSSRLHVYIWHDVRGH